MSSKQSVKDAQRSDKTASKEHAPVGPEFGADRNRRAISTLLVVLIVAALYAKAVGYDFITLDDNIHVYANPYFQPVTASHLAYFLTHPYEKLYIPLSYLVFGALTVIAAKAWRPDDSAMPGVTLDPQVFHAANILVHLATTLIVLAILRRLVKNEFAALCGALLFAVHPVQVESVAWISELRGLLAGFFTIWSLLLYSKAIDTALPQPLSPPGKGGKRGVGMSSFNRYYAGAVVTLLAALLSKPSAIAAPLMFLAVDGLMVGRPWRDALRTAAPLFVLCIPFAVVAHFVQPAPFSVQTPLIDRPLVAGDALAFYLLKVVAPYPLGLLYGRTPHAVLSSHVAAGTTAACFAVVVLLYLIGRKRRYIHAGLAVFVAALLPVLGLTPFFYQVFSTVSDRYLYLAMFGPALIVAGALASGYPSPPPPLPSRERTEEGSMKDSSPSLNEVGHFGRVGEERAGVGSADSTGIKPEAIWPAAGKDSMRDAVGITFRTVAVLVLVACGVLTSAQISYWQDPITLMRHAVAVSPRSAYAHMGLATTYSTANRPDLAAPEFQAAASLDPNSVVPDQEGGGSGSVSPAVMHNNLGNILMQQGSVNEAMEEYQKAIDADPRFATALSNIGNGYMRKNEVGPAIAEYRMALRIDPNLPTAHSGLAYALLQSGDRRGSLIEYRTAIAAHPNDAPLHTSYGVALATGGDLVDSIAEFQAALRIDPRYDPAKENLKAAIKLQAAGHTPAPAR